MWEHAPSRVVRRRFTDQSSGLEVLEESAYFDVPEGEGEDLAAAVRAEQEARTGTPGGGRIDDIVLLRKRKVGAAKAGKAEAEAEVEAEAEEEVQRQGAAAAAAVALSPRRKSATGSGGAGGVRGGSPAEPRGASSGKGVGAAAAPQAAAQAAAAPAWEPLEIPTRPSDWVPAQRVLAGERALPPSTALADSTISSLNPPAPLDTLPKGTAAELSHRLVVAVSMGVHSGGMKISASGDKVALSQTPLIKVMLKTFLPSAQPHHSYRFYFAFDHNDPVYEVEANRAALAELYAEAFAAEDALRWHPAGYSREAHLDGSSLLASVHWVHCDYSGKPGWAHSDASVAAVLEGADYVYRSNDDSEFPRQGDWVDRWIKDLRSRSPVPNIGVTGPTCNEGATW